MSTLLQRLLFALILSGCVATASENTSKSQPMDGVWQQAGMFQQDTVFIRVDKILIDTSTGNIAAMFLVSDIPTSPFVVELTVNQCLIGSGTLTITFSDMEQRKYPWSRGEQVSLGDVAASALCWYYTQQINPKKLFV